MKPLDKHILSVIELPPQEFFKQKGIIPASPTSVLGMDTCPMKFNGSYGITIPKVPYQQNSAAIKGQRMHEAAEDFLKMGMPLSPAAQTEYPTLQHRLDTYRNHPDFNPVLVEASLQVNQEGACEWRDRAMGVKSDLLMNIFDGKGLFYMDWKTQGTHDYKGRVKHPKLDIIQTEMTAITAFMADPKLEIAIVVIEFVCHGKQIKAHFSRNKDTYTVQSYDGTITENNFTLPDQLRRYWHIQRTKQFAPKPGGLCNGWCEVTVCPHNVPARTK